MVLSAEAFFFPSSRLGLLLFFSASKLVLLLFPSFVLLGIRFLKQSTHLKRSRQFIILQGISDKPVQIKGEHFREAGSNTEVDWEILGRIHHLSINVWSDVNQFRFVRFSSFSTEIEILRRLKLFRVGCLKMHDNCCQASYFPFLWIMYPEYTQHNHCLTRIWFVVRDYRQKKLACCLSAF